MVDHKYQKRHRRKQKPQQAHPVPHPINSLMQKISTSRFARKSSKRVRIYLLVAAGCLLIAGAFIFRETIFAFFSSGNSPVAIWNIDEGYGTTAYDTSGNANDLTISGASWQTSAGNEKSTATSLHFDGTNDYMSVSDTGSFQFGTDSFTLSGWFRHPSTAPASGTQMLIARHEDAGWKLYMNSSGYICFGVDDDATWDPDASVCTTAELGSLADSRWHHVSAVKDSTSSIAIYIDGELINEVTTGIPTGSLD